MMSRGARALLSTLAVVAGLLAVPVIPAHADDEPDTTPPQVRLNPCLDGETSCQRVRAEVYGDLEPGDDLAVLGARIGDQVLAEQVYDDGTGFVPHGSFVSYGNDVVIPYDYALSIPVPAGTSDITFYARDLEGNTSELTTTVDGPVPPGPVRHLTAEITSARHADVEWRVPNLKGSCCARYVATTPGHRDKHAGSYPPVYQGARIHYAGLGPGWHRFTVRATTEGGSGPARSVRLYVPHQRHR
ncbi:fibronectin type III domain-containing protein [Nocardioides mangrovi]|uniref:Fibronectin type III domain-containing protein n=1 Tax=Nocardioides mangrovi TaxID=2874580 RepID=A0ABS7UCE4_9ACTN|nr:fibronectin type III domain-containing protein [Nocardioides mangrovi]MBZ5738684.1 fibronectin type III domain-containing protein [Nocardioides mangrovi]